ncbi:MAG: restriction endonuclease [Chryseobacterium culicis]
MNEQNSLDWKKYESITKYIYQTLGQEYNIHIEGHGNDCKVKGDSGVSHQIDVLTSESDGINTYRTAIECKYWNKKINKDIVMKLWAIVHDAQLSQGIIVSKSGFTPDAQKFADFYNIKLVELREIEDQDTHIEKEVELGVLELSLNTHLRRPEITKMIVQTLDDREIVLLERKQYQVFIEDLNGQKMRLFDTIMTFKEHLHQQTPFQSVTKCYDHLDHTLYLDEHSFKIKSISYTGILTVINENHRRIFSLVDHVWLIMKSIFERQTFLITDYGMIVKKEG